MKPITLMSSIPGLSATAEVVDGRSWVRLHYGVEVTPPIPGNQMADIMNRVTGELRAQLGNGSVEIGGVIRRVFAAIRQAVPN
jgi:hypothetical protein